MVLDSLACELPFKLSKGSWILLDHCLDSKDHCLDRKDHCLDRKDHWLDSKDHKRPLLR